MFEPLLSAPLAIQFHAAGAMLALVLGPLALFRPKRDRLHKVAGYLWVMAMGVTIASSFAIFQIRLLGPFSPIHALSVLAAIGLLKAVRAALRGDIATHRARMRSLYVWALGLAGLFTLLPGRIMSRVLFPQAPLAGFVISLALAALAVFWLRWRRHRPGSRRAQV